MLNPKSYVRDKKSIKQLTRQLHHTQVTSAEDYKAGIEVNLNCTQRSKSDSKLGRVAFTGFTKSSGLMEVLSLIAHETGFEKGYSLDLVVRKLYFVNTLD